MSADDWQAQLAAEDKQIATLEGKVAEAAKTAEVTEALNAEIAALKQQMVDERVQFALKSAGARNEKAVRALLDDYEDISKLREAESWMFAETGATSQKVGGATGLEPTGVAGGGDERYMRHWERIAGLANEKE